MHEYAKAHEDVFDFFKLFWFNSRYSINQFIYSFHSSQYHLVHSQAIIHNHQRHKSSLLTSDL